MNNQLVCMLAFFFFLIINIHGKKYHELEDDVQSTMASSASDKNLLVDVDIYHRPYVLPYFLRQLEQLTCPCNKCYLDLHLYNAFNTTVENETRQLLNQWVSSMKNSNQSVFTTITIFEWTAKSKVDRPIRLSDMMNRAHKLDITYLAMFDCMIILLEPENIFSTLISKDKPLMAPLLRATKDVFTSTFYLNADNESALLAYKNIYERKTLGCFRIDGGIRDFIFFNFNHPKVREVFITNRNAKEIQQDYAVDIIASDHSIPSYVCNRELFGYISAQYRETINDEIAIHDLYIHMLMEHQLSGPSQSYLPSIPRTTLINMPLSKENEKFGLDEVYVINLARRSDRRERLKATFDILDRSVRFFDAVDGKNTIDRAYLERLNVRPLPNYEDPYHQRSINYGEIGSFLSHYSIWQDMIKNKYANGALILEDDVRFDVSFKYKLEQVISNRSLDWDIIYLGRKAMHTDEENYENITAKYLIEPSYSHWTIGYALSLRGAQMLVDENPIQKVLPVDEYLPIMYDRHPNTTWKSYFTNRKLKTYAFHPSILTPTHYFGEPNYTSDIEGTQLYQNNESTSTSVKVDVAALQKQIEENASMQKHDL